MIQRPQSKQNLKTSHSPRSIFPFKWYPKITKKRCFKMDYDPNPNKSRRSRMWVSSLLHKYHLPIPDSDQALFRNPVLCWGHKSKISVLFSSGHVSRFLPHRNPQTERHSNILAFCQQSTPVGWGDAKCGIQHCTPCLGSNLLRCTAFCYRLSAVVVDGRKVCYIFANTSFRGTLSIKR